jgi:hypothetical protein
LEKTRQVISTHLPGGFDEVRVYSESSSGEGFGAAEADLDDVYFLNLANAERK